jgi:hypothetical protein
MHLHDVLYKFLNQHLSLWLAGTEPVLVIGWLIDGDVKNSTTIMQKE